MVKKKKADRVDRGVGEEVRETSHNLLYEFILIDLYGKLSFSMKKKRPSRAIFYDVSI